LQSLPSYYEGESPPIHITPLLGFTLRAREYLVTEFFFTTPNIRNRKPQSQPHQSSSYSCKSKHNRSPSISYSSEFKIPRSSIDSAMDSHAPADTTDVHIEEVIEEVTDAVTEDSAANIIEASTKVIDAVIEDSAANIIEAATNNVIEASANVNQPPSSSHTTSTCRTSHPHPW
jgi:hypothetical protein